MNLKQKSVMFLATGCFIGNISFAPGTFGSILGLLLCLFLSKINLLIAVFLTVVFIFFSIWIAQEAKKIVNTEDPGCIVIDEIAGILVTFTGLPFNVISIAFGFLVFRALDIWKPYPISWIERKLSGGAGIVMDDVAAGICSNMVLRSIFFLYN
jgi:phosphatidylglycerophosphatase A